MKLANVIRSKFNITSHHLPTNNAAAGDFILHTCQQGDEIGSYHDHRELISASSVAHEIINHFTHKKYRDWFSDQRSLTAEFIKSIFCERYEDHGGAWLYTVAEWEAKQRDDKRKQCERTVAGIARKHACGADSLALLGIIHKMISSAERAADDDICGNSENAMERRMEHAASCMYNGVGSETFFDDVNFTRSRHHDKIDELRDAMEWIAEECPMLWMKFQEEIENDDSGLDFDMM